MRLNHAALVGFNGVQKIPKQILSHGITPFARYSHGFPSMPRSTSKWRRAFDSSLFRQECPARRPLRDTSTLDSKRAAPPRAAPRATAQPPLAPSAAALLLRA